MFVALTSYRMLTGLISTPCNILDHKISTDNTHKTVHSWRTIHAKRTSCTNTTPNTYVYTYVWYTWYALLLLATEQLLEVTKYFFGKAHRICLLSWIYTFSPAWRVRALLHNVVIKYVIWNNNFFSYYSTIDGLTLRHKSPQNGNVTL